jgi:hypothetical protein
MVSVRGGGHSVVGHAVRDDGANIPPSDASAAVS